VLVDNCSTDGSTAIAERLAHGNGRVRLVRNEKFLTQVQNYNHALAQISPAARYTKMVQADDAIRPRCLTEMVELAEAHPSIGVVSSHRLVGSDVMPSSLREIKTFLPGREAARVQLVDDVSLFASPTSVMLRADVVRARSPFYAEGRYFEDVDVIYELLREHDFGFVPQILTFMRRDEGSTWGKMRSYHPGDLSRLLQLKTYGRDFLPPEEYQRVLGAHEREYRRLLAVAWLQRREARFWDYHREGLATIGESIDRATLIRDALLEAGRQVLSPRSALASAVRLTRARRAERGRAQS
jgi:glycosyltransferase involved in cell wall biosynthesis